MNKKIRLLLADDHPVVRKGIRSCLEQREHLEIIGEAENGKQALEQAILLSPDIVLMDLDMPEMSGLSVAEQLGRTAPHIRVLILTMHDSKESIMRMIQAGARGYVLKDSPVDELVRAIDTVQSGDSFFSPEVARVALNQFVQGDGQSQSAELTEREQDVLVQIAEGLSNKEIASQLGVGVRTVETHRERIMRKLNIHSVAGLTKYAISRGLVGLESGHRPSPGKTSPGSGVSRL